MSLQFLPLNQFGIYGCEADLYTLADSKAVFEGPGIILSEILSVGYCSPYGTKGNQPITITLSTLPGLLRVC